MHQDLSFDCRTIEILLLEQKLWFQTSHPFSDFPYKFLNDLYYNFHKNPSFLDVFDAELQKSGK